MKFLKQFRIKKLHVEPQKENRYQIETACVTHTGNIRSQNQDNFSLNQI